MSLRLWRWKNNGIVVRVIGLFRCILKNDILHGHNISYANDILALRYNGRGQLLIGLIANGARCNENSFYVLALSCRNSETEHKSSRDQDVFLYKGKNKLTYYKLVYWTKLVGTLHFVVALFLSD